MTRDAIRMPVETLLAEAYAAVTGPILLFAPEKISDAEFIGRLQIYEPAFRLLLIGYGTCCAGKDAAKWHDNEADCQRNILEQRLWIIARHHFLQLWSLQR